MDRAAKDSTAADSIMSQFDKIYGQDLESAKKGRLKLGLDLRGGMYVTLEVDVVQLLEESADPDAKDEILEQVINKTRAEAKMSDKNAIDIFLKNFDEIARPRRKYLSDYYPFGNATNIADQEKQVESKLRENEKEAIDQAIQVIRQRVDKYGISEPTIQKSGSRRILLELPGVTDEKKMLDLLKTTARLEFKLVQNDRNLVRAFYNIDKFLAREAQLRAKGLSADSVFASDSTNIAENNKDADNSQDTAKATNSNNNKGKDTSNPYANLPKEEAAKRYMADHPFTSLFSTLYSPEGKRGGAQEISYVSDNFPDGDYNFSAHESQIKKIEKLLNRPEVRNLLPEATKVYLSAKPDVMKDRSGKEQKFFNLFGCKDFAPKLTGEVISDAAATFDPTNNRPLVNMTMNSDGSDRWAKITGANIGKRIAIILDDQVYSAPVVQNKIAGGSSQITGMADADEAKLLQIVLKAGALKAPVQTIEVRVVGPSLGEDSIRDGLWASLVAVILVVGFMGMYYKTGGLIADFAVVLNIVLIIAIMAAFDGTLTLPGIAGIILTLGMAVDANVLIFERIREELYHGRSLRSSIDEGYKKALSAIIDSNVTTFITGLILYFFGTGTIQGFAMTLMIGIIMTLFTAITVTKAIVEIMLARGATSINFGQPKTIAN